MSEDRLDATDVDFKQDIPDVASVTSRTLPRLDANAADSWQRLAHAFLGGVIPDQQALGRHLRSSFLTRAVVQALAACLLMTLYVVAPAKPRHESSVPSSAPAVTMSAAAH